MSENNGIIRTFSQLIAVVEDGQLNDDLNHDVEDLVATLQDSAAVGNRKAKGEITIKIRMTADGGVIDLSSDYSVKKPKITRARSVFWVTPDNQLSRKNPKQHELPLRDVSQGPASVKTV